MNKKILYYVNNNNNTYVDIDNNYYIDIDKAKSANAYVYINGSFKKVIPIIVYTTYIETALADERDNLLLNENNIQLTSISDDYVTYNSILCMPKIFQIKE